MIRDALLSEDGKYRHALVRIWDADKKPMLWIMLNPSTADANIDDPTIRRCIGFAMRDEYGAIHVVNQFDFRATDPSRLIDEDKPRSSYCESYVRGAIESTTLRGGMVVAAWGSTLNKWGRRHLPLLPVASYFPDRQIHCLGVTKSGEPKHPLYLASSTSFVAWNGIEQERATQ